MLRPTDVYTPGKLPLAPTNVYAPRTRDDAQRKLGKTLERGLVPLVFGEYGVGKTSMARYLRRAEEAAGRLVHIESVAGKSLADVMTQCLEKVGYTVQRRQVSSSSSETADEQSGQAKAGIGWLEAIIGSKRTKSQTSGQVREEEIVVTSPTSSRILEVCEANALVLLIDELHKASELFAQELANFLKAYGNANCRAFKILLLGTASEATRLVNIDPGIDRLITEIHLRAMDEKEARYVVEEGMKSLAISISDTEVRKLVDVCVGSPNILQYLCLECAEAAWDRRTRVIEATDVATALREYVESREARLYRTYMAAIETVGDRRYRKRVLHAMAECEDEYVTMEQIREGVTKTVGQAVPSSTLSGPLRDLKSAKFGPVLQDVKRPDASGRLANYTVFVDPTLKAFVRLLARKAAVVGTDDQLPSCPGAA
jgi:hypothetical protein